MKINIYILKKTVGFFTLMYWHVSFDKKEHNGIIIRVPFEAPEEELKKVTDALDLIEQHDPLSFSRIPRLLPGGIAISRLENASLIYNLKRKACILGLDYLATTNRQGIAFLIMHELCRARLKSRGVCYDEPVRFRVEKICMRRERAFARLLDHHCGHHGLLTDWVQDRIDSLSPDSYTDQHLARLKRLDALSILKRRKTQIPRWLRRCLIMRARLEFPKQRAIARTRVCPGTTTADGRSEKSAEARR